MEAFLKFIFSIEPLKWGGLLSTLLSGGIIGFERQLLGKPVGIRTSMLICAGTYSFVVISNSVSNSGTDPSRIIGQIVTGIGFLGAGVMLAKDGIVVGVTSASAIWMLAAIGVVIALGSYMTGIKLSLLSVFVLVGIDLVEHRFKILSKGVYRKGKKKAEKFSGD